MENTLIWKGIKAEDMGVKIISLPPIERTEEEVSELEIDGRDGTLTEHIRWKSSTKEVIADCRGGNPREIIDWLEGSGNVIFGNQPDVYFKARISNTIPLEQIIENYLYSFPIEFSCQPFKYHIDGERTRVIKENNFLLLNSGTYISKPKIKIYGSGTNIISINNRSFTLSQIDQYVIIDSELQQVFKEQTNKGRYMSGEFPYFDTRNNVIKWTGNISRMEIIPRWRSK